MSRHSREGGNLGTLLFDEQESLGPHLCGAFNSRMPDYDDPINCLHLINLPQLTNLAAYELQAGSSASRTRSGRAQRTLRRVFHLFKKLVADRFELMRLGPVPVYLIGGIASYWVFERVVGFWG